ncbi:ABC transporter permease [Actinopolymorpha pittospori]|uniref:Peptide/nickel transport system permease protein n=1 Tax=Actinopolymorpha pittospori TaxID=648752 RepID=A0A927RGJ4_9ACTN|nr:ABC transporter permease [Actinopolymorpha pittospori]MBE1611250.1 peptide/nickel transport system permease protein [Actinopolymorpha pittospori]
MTYTDVTLEEGPPADQGPTPVRRPPRGIRVVRRIRRNPLAVAGFVVLALAVLGALLAPLLAPYSPDETHFELALSPPGTAGYLLGTDDLGRDLLSRILFGLRSSLQAGVLAVLVALVVGVPLGLAAGYSHWLDALISRLTDLVLAFPFLILAVGLAAVRGPSLGNAAVAIGIAQIPGVVRIVRGETLRLKALDFVAAAVVSSASDAWVLLRHILPNATSAIIVQATVAIPGAILGEAVLSFLGLGIRPPQPSLGTMLSDAQQYATRAPWTAVIPGVAIMLVALAFNLFGDGLRDALDPKSSRR